MAKITLTDPGSLAGVVAAIASNNTAIETAIENTLSRDGTSPNTMSSDLDMNGNSINNLPTPASGAEPATKTYVDDEVERLENLIDDIIVAEDRATGVDGPSSSTNNRLVQFQGTSGQILKEYTGTGILSTTSGVPGSLSLPTGVLKSDGTQFQAAVDNTDYTTPSTADSRATTVANARIAANIGVTVQAYNSNLLKTTIGWVIGDGVNTITTGNKLGLRVPFPCTITGWAIGLDTSGSIVIDVWKDTQANYPPTVADTITASAKPTVSTATGAASTTLTSWTTSIAAGDWLFFNVDSVTSAKKCTVQLDVMRT